MQKQNLNESQSGRSMVEMLGVLAVIGVLSISGIAGYKYAMDQIKVNNLNQFVQKFYLAMESGLNDLNSQIHVMCKMYNGGDNCKREKFQELCDTYLGAENCKTYSENSWGGYAINHLKNDYYNTDFKGVYWHYRTRTDKTIYLQITNMKPSICSKFVRSLDPKQYPRLFGLGPYCNAYCTNTMVTDFSDTAKIEAICQPNSYDYTYFTLMFDAPELDIIDATDEN